MLKHRRQIIFFLALISVASWIYWWASSGFPLEGQICEITNPPQNCTSHNIIFYSAWRLAAATDHWSALITAVATAFVAWFTWTLWQSSDEMEKLTERMVGIQEKQMLIVGQQTDIASKQHALDRLQFISSKRPRLHVRHVIMEHPTPKAKHRLPVLQATKPIKGSLVIVNVGGTGAWIVSSQYRFYWTNNELPMDPPLDQVGPLHAETVELPGGSSCTFPITASDLLGPHASEIMKGRDNWRLYVMGSVEYADTNGKTRFMGFCREYKRPGLAGGDGRFSPVDNPDYEYQD